MNLDFETACAAELSKTGAYLYTRHPTFRITTLLYRLDSSDEYRKWIGFYDPDLNPEGEPIPWDLIDALNAGEEIIGWNVSFERYCLEHMRRMDASINAIPFEQFRCTMQQAAIVGLPLSLANCGTAVRSSVEKDQDGRTIMLQTAKPRNGAALSRSECVRVPKKGDAELTWYNRKDDPDKFNTLDSYCLKDVQTEEAIGDLIPPMTPGERKLAIIDAKINNRGLPIDRPAVERALELVDFCKEDGDRQLSELTDGHVPAASQLPKLKEWLKSRGCEMEKVTKETIPEVLLDSDLDPQVRQVLELRMEGSAASLSKLQTMLHLCCEDDRMRDQFQYSGAHTGRWAGRGSQPQNFFKGWGLEEQNTPYDEAPPEQTKFFSLLMQDKPIEDVAADIRAEFGDLITPMKNALRGFIRAPEGYEFYVCDFAGIENRVVAWLSNEQGMIEAFRNNEDLYKLTASGIYETPVEEVTKAQRALGKVCVLAAQFGQGPKGYQASCAGWGIDIDLKEARKTIKGYRETYPLLRQFWYDLYRAMMSSVNSGESFVVGRVKTECSDGSLRIVLPSGRKIYYWNPTVKEVEAPWSYHEVTLGFTPTEDQIEEFNIIYKDGWQIRDMDLPAFEDEFDDYVLGKHVPKYCYQLYHETLHKNKWTPINKENPSRIHSTWHGVAVENVTQAVARDVLAEAVMRVEAAGFELVGYVHDELIALVPAGQKRYDEYERIMLQTPRWAKGLPISGEGYVAERYRK